MASTDTPPRFIKVFISHFSSDSMLIPISYYDELPRHLPKAAILQGTGGCIWKVAMKQEGEEVYFGQGWPKFVEDNSLVDGDFLTFVYNGDRIFEVSIYGLDGCKQARAVTELEGDDEEDSICSLSSDDTDTVQRSKDKGKSKDEVVEVESDDREDSNYSLDSEDKETDTGSEFKMAKNKGKKQKEVEESGDEDSDSDYVEEFGRLDLEENSSSDSSYAPDSDDTATHVKPKETNPKGKSKVVVAVDDIGDSSCSVVRVKKTREKVKTIIKNPEAYLDDPTNICFETGVKNRKYELLVRAQLVKDYCLRFKNKISYIDPKGKLEAKTAKWRDQRVCIKRWMRICERNKLKKEDRVVCELLRNQDLVYAVKIHIIRGKYL